MALTGFPTSLTCGVANTPGVLTTLEAVPLIWVAAFEQVQNADFEQRSPVILLTGSWLPIVVMQGSGAWTEETQDDSQGPHYRIVLDGLSLPGDNAATRGQLNAFKQHRWLLRLRDKDGQTFVVGDPERRGLAFSHRFESGSKSGDFRGYRLRFEGVCLGITPGYNPVL